MNYTKIDYLARRGHCESEDDDTPEHPLFAGDVVASWDDAPQTAGYDRVFIRPAMYGGEPAWLERRMWCPTGHYSGGGTEDTVLEFREGVDLLLQHGAFTHLFPE